jgi:hypothetical protein
MSTDPVTGKCDLAIEGVVPGNNPTIAAISLYPVGHINVSITSDGATDATSMALLEHADLVGTDNLSFPQDVVDLQAAMDVSECNGDGGRSMTIDFADAMGLYDTFLGDSFDKAFGFTDYGDGTCDFDQMYDFELSLADTLSNQDIYVEPFDLTVRFTLCDEKAGGLCVLTGAGGEGDMILSIENGDGIVITDGAIDVMANDITLWFNEDMNSSTINLNTVYLTDISNTEKDVEYTIVETVENAEYKVIIGNTAEMAQEELQLVLSNDILNLNNEYYAGATLNFTTSWAVGDALDKNSITKYDFDNTVEAIPIGSTWATAPAVVQNYLDFAAMTYETPGLVVSNANQPDDTAIAVFASEELILPNTGIPTTADGEIWLTDVVGFDRDNGLLDRDMLGMAVSNGVTGDLTFVGVVAGIDSTFGMPIAKDIAFFYDGALGEVTHCRWRDHNAANIGFKLESNPVYESVMAYTDTDDSDWIPVEWDGTFSGCPMIEMQTLPFGMLTTSRDAGLLVHFATRDILEVNDCSAKVVGGFSKGVKSADEITRPLMWEEYPARDIIMIAE